MKRLIRNSLVALNNRLFLLSMIPFFLASVPSHAQYQPSEDNIKSRKEFSDCKFGIFLHWGIYSMFGQGEWYMNDAGIDCQEYAKAASGFYPSRLMQMSGYLSSRMPVPNISASRHAITTVFRCSTRNFPIITSSKPHHSSAMW